MIGSDDGRASATRWCEVTLGWQTRAHARWDIQGSIDGKVVLCYLVSMSGATLVVPGAEARHTSARPGGGCVASAGRTPGPEAGEVRRRAALT